MKWVRARLLDILLVVALATVAAQRALSNVHELFAGGAAIGQVLATLATGYTGAWFFNLINLRLPKNRDKKAMVSVAGVAVAHYASQSRAILQDMAGSLSLPNLPRKPDQAILHYILDRTYSNGASKRTRSFTPPFTPLAWLQSTIDTLQEKRALLERISVLYPHLSAGTTSTITAINETRLVRLAANFPEFPNLGQGSKMGILESEFWEHWVACDALCDQYMDEIFPLLDESKRLDLDAGEAEATEAWAAQLDEDK